METTTMSNIIEENMVSSISTCQCCGAEYLVEDEDYTVSVWNASICPDCFNEYE